MLARMSLTLTDTAWARKSAAAFVPLSGYHLPASGWRFRSIEVISVATNTCSFAFNERVGNVDGGTRGAIVIPEASQFGALAKSTLTLGTLVITFIATGSSSGTTVSTAGKTRAAVAAEVAALITALATGIADIEVADAEEDGLIVLQSDASSVVQSTWTRGPGSGAIRLFAAGLAPAGAVAVAAGATLPRREFAAYDDVRAISVRANTANSVIVVEAEIEPGGATVR